MRITIILAAALLLAAAPLFSQNKGASPLANPQSVIANPHSTRAVVIGISDYQDPAIPDLRFAHKDAEAFAAFLRSPAGGSLTNDQMKVLINSQATTAQFAAALDWLMEETQEGENAMIYFSGHGDVETKTMFQLGYLLTWDSPPQTYVAGAFPLQYLQAVVTTLSTQKKARIILVTDACRSGKLAGSTVGGTQLTGANLAKQFSNEIKILSCQPNEYSIEGEQWGGGRGAFSYHLIDGLYGLADNNADQQVTLTEIGRYLEDHVTAEVAPQSQAPMILGNRTETLAKVFPDLKEKVEKSRAAQMPQLLATETRGVEEDVLAKSDTAIRKMYADFNQAIQDKAFLPIAGVGKAAGNCADALYQKLVNEPELKPLHSAMTRNYAAALQDDAQQVLNRWLKTDISEIVLSKKTQTAKYQAYPAYLQRAAELLGEQHYMYRDLMARRQFFEGYLLALADRNPDIEAGKKALAKFRQALKWQTALPHVYLEMAMVYSYNLQQPDSAYHYAMEAARLSPSWVLPYRDMAFVFSDKFKQHERAKSLLDMASKIDPNSVVVWTGLGLFYEKQKDFQQAEQWYKKAIAKDPAYTYAWLNLGNVYSDTRRYAEAEKTFKKAIALDSTDAYPYNNLGNVYRNTQRHAEAEQMYLKAIALDATDAYPYNNLGIVYLNTRREGEAGQMFQKAMKADPSYAAPCNNLGKFYKNSHRYEESEKMFLKAAKLDSTTAYPFTNLADIYAETKQHPKAEKMLLKVVEIEPQNADAWYNLACQSSLNGNTARAIEYFDQSLKNGWKDYDWPQKDSDLAALRDLPQWKPLMKKYFPEKAKD